MKFVTCGSRSWSCKGKRLVEQEANFYKDRKSMKSPDIENIVVDEVHELTYVVMAHKVLNDGELYSAIRVELLKRRSFPAKGERLVITAPKVR